VPQPEVSVITLFHNRWDLVRLYIRQWRSARPDPGKVELIFGDCASTDGAAAVAATAADIADVALFPKNLGFARGNNVLARKARGRVLVFLNFDVHFTPGWLEELVAVFSSGRSPKSGRPGLGVAGNVQFSVKARLTDHAGIFFDPAGRPFHFRPPAGALTEMGFFPVPAVTGACLAIRRDLFAKLGGFDEGYRNSYEDVDLCLRARAAGAEIGLAARSAIWHHVSSSPGRYDAEEVNAARFAERWAETARGLSKIQPPALPVPAAGEGIHPALAADETIQVYFPSRDGYSEARCAHYLYPRNVWARIDIPLPTGLDAKAFPLRLDPSRNPGRFSVAEVALRQGCEGPVVWLAGGAALAGICRVSGTCRLLPGGPEMNVESLGEDPQLLLDLPSEILSAADGLVLEIRLLTDSRRGGLAHEDRGSRETRGIAATNSGD
jgi:GT2 family glycosyltransferase